MKLSIDSSASFPTSNIVTAWFFSPIDKFPIIKNAVRVESNMKAILFVEEGEVSIRITKKSKNKVL